MSPMRHYSSRHLLLEDESIQASQGYDYATVRRTHNESSVETAVHTNTPNVSCSHEISTNSHQDLQLLIQGGINSRTACHRQFTNTPKDTSFGNLTPPSRSAHHQGKPRLAMTKSRRIRITQLLRSFDQSKTSTLCYV